MSPFPQSVTNSSAFPTVFLSPPAVLQVVIVNLVFRSISNGHAGSVDKVSLSRLVQRCLMSKSVLLSYIIIADVTRVKREVK